MSRRAPLTMYILHALLILAAGYLAMCLYVYLRQDALVFIPSRELAMVPSDAGMPFEDLTLRTPDGEQIHAWFIPAPPGTSRPWTLLNCHGNAGNIGDRVAALRSCNAAGFNVMIFDYRGYGRSTGRPSEAGTYTDALAAWTYLVEQRGLPAARIIVYGHSLGGAIAAWLAARTHPGVLWLESAFTSTGDVGARLYPYLPVRRLARHRYATVEHLAHVKSPVAIGHAIDDETIPIAHGRQLFAHAGEPKIFLPYQGDHNAVAFDSDPAYRRDALAWLNALPPR